MSRNLENKFHPLPIPALNNPRQAQQAYGQAQKLQQAGYLTEAENLYRQILAIIPGQPDCLHYLGMIFMQNGDLDKAREYMEHSIKITSNPVFLCNYGILLSNSSHEEAIQHYEKALELKPDYVEAWYNLGVSNSALGKYDLAEDAYKKAVSFRANYLKALYNLACVQELLAKKDESQQTIDRILSISADSAEVHNTIGDILTRIGGNKNLKTAEQHFRQALMERPDFLEAYTNLGKLYESGNQMEDAIKCYSRILELEPKSIEAKINLATSLVSNDQIEQAHDIFSNVLESQATNTIALCGTGDIQRIKGDFQGAEKLYEQALAINQSEIRAYIGLSNCKKFSSADGQFIEKLKNLSGVDTGANYALGKIHNDLEDYDAAFAYYKNANELRNNKIDYNADENTDTIRRIIETFSVDLINELHAGGDPSELPVFIIGTPRSGTTLAEQIISSHPEVFGAGELKYIASLFNNFKKNIGKKASYPELIHHLTPADMKLMASEYINKTIALCGETRAKRITDKMPGNYIYAGYLACLFPQAKIVHCKRNPLDACLSIYFQAFGTGHRYSFDLHNLGHWYKDYLCLMEHWQKLLGDRIYTLNYEDLVNNTEVTAKKLLAYCSLEWNDQCLQYYTSRRKVKTASQWQVRQPVYKTSLERWKQYDKHIGQLKEILAGHY